MPEAYFLYFCYGTGWIVLPAVAGATVNTVVNILADADFQANYMTIVVKQADVLVTTWGGNLQIDDSGRGRTLFNVPNPVDHWGGNGRLPYPFNPPRLFRRNSSVTIILTNNVATETHVSLVFHGNKLTKEEEL